MSEQSTLEDFHATAETDDSVKKKPYRDESWLREQYHEQKKTTYEIADTARVCQSTILRWMKKHGIERRSPSKARTDGHIELLEDPEWLREQYLENECTLSEIADLVDVSRGTVRDRMKKHGIERRSQSEIHSDGNIEPLRNEEWLREQYWEQNKTLREISDEVNLSPTAVRNWMDRHDIETRSLSESHTDGNVDRLANKEWLRDQYRNQKKSPPEIADEIDVHAATVRSWIERHGIKKHSLSKRYTDGNVEPLKDPEWLHEQYNQNKKSSNEIAEELGLSGGSVLKWLEKHGIERRSVSEARAAGNIKPLMDEEWLSDQYHGQEKTRREIAEELDLSFDPVATWMEKHGIEPRSESKADGNVEPLKDPEWLREQYFEQEKTTYEIAEELGLHSATVRDWMEKHEMERRSQSEAQTEGNTEPLRNEEWLRRQYCEQKKTTYEIADELHVSPSTVRNWMKKYGIKPHSPVPTPDHLDHIVRSEWELEIANLLCDIGIDYQYEAVEIEYGGDRTYIPDFVTSKYIIEIKGAFFGEVYDDNRDADAKAEAAMSQFDEREYVVVGKKLPCDIHIPWKERATIHRLF